MLEVRNYATFLTPSWKWGGWGEAACNVNDVVTGCWSQGPTVASWSTPWRRPRWRGCISGHRTAWVPTRSRCAGQRSLQVVCEHLWEPTRTVCSWDKASARGMHGRPMQSRTRLPPACDPLCMFLPMFVLRPRFVPLLPCKDEMLNIDCVICGLWSRAMGLFVQHFC